MLKGFIIFLERAAVAYTTAGYNSIRVTNTLCAGTTRRNRERRNFLRNAAANAQHPLAGYTTNRRTCSSSSLRECTPRGKSKRVLHLFLLEALVVIIMSGRSPRYTVQHLLPCRDTTQKVKTKQKHSTSSNTVVIIYCYIGCKEKATTTVVTLGQQYNVGENPPLCCTLLYESPCRVTKHNKEGLGAF